MVQGGGDWSSRRPPKQENAVQIICNHPGGIGLHHGVRLFHGTNSVDPNAWAENQKSLHSDFLAGLLEPRDKGVPAMVVVVDGESKPPPMSAKDKCTMVLACNSLDELDRLARDENRKTVLAAIDKRMHELAEAEE